MISIKDIENVIALLNSNNVEDHRIALNIIDAQYSKSKVILMMFYKFGLPKDKLWKEEASSAYDTLLIDCESSINGENIVDLSFKYLYDCIKADDYNFDNMKLYMKYFEKFLSEDSGFKIKIKIEK